MKNLVKLLDDWEDHARRLLFEDGFKQLPPTFILFGEDHQTAVIPCPWNNDFEKDMMVTVVKEVSRKISAHSAVFFGEAWQLSLDKNEPYERPSESPKRIEVVQIMATDGKDAMMRRLQMIRDKPGGILISLIKDGEDLAGVEGRMVDGIIQK